MKKKVFILIIAIISITAACLAGCDKNNSFNNLDYYDFKDFTSLKNFTVINSEEKDTVAKYDNDSSRILFMTETDSTEGVNNDVFYYFSAEENKTLVGENWQEINLDDVDDYLSSIADRTGLSYTKVQEAYVTEVNDRKYSIDADHFFKELFRQKYEMYFGKTYEESEFTVEYEKQKEELFGNMDNYMIMLDCTKKKKMTLSITKNEDGKQSVSTYEYSNIGDTKIDIPKM